MCSDADKMDRRGYWRKGYQSGIWLKWEREHFMEEKRFRQQSAVSEVGTKLDTSRNSKNGSVERIEFIRGRTTEGKISEVAETRLQNPNSDIRFYSKYDERSLWGILERELIQTDFYFLKITWLLCGE